MTFWDCRKNGLIRKVSLISKLMTLQPGLTNNCDAHIAQYLTKLSQSDLTYQLIEYNKKNILFKNYAENEVGTIAPDLFLFF